MDVLHSKAKLDQPNQTARARPGTPAHGQARDPHVQGAAPLRSCSLASYPPSPRHHVPHLAPLRAQWSSPCVFLTQVRAIVLYTVCTRCPVRRFALQTIGLRKFRRPRTRWEAFSPIPPELGDVVLGLGELRKHLVHHVRSYKSLTIHRVQNRVRWLYALYA